MKRILLAIISMFLLEANVTSAAPLQLCLKADRVVEGQPREGSKIVLRSECKKRSNGTPIEVSIGTSDSLGGGGDATGLTTQVNSLSDVLRTFTCGDGQIESRTGETCDDGNVIANDGCSPVCEVESGWTCNGKASDCDIVCGDEIVVSPEICDDGNTSDGDGCSADCLSDETCGNGSTDPLAGEVCDDGGQVDGDGCSADCLSDETCGNGVTDRLAGEDCDDGNAEIEDGCTPTCTLECGDGVTQPNEVCDDGGTQSGDGCSADCLSDETCGNGIVDVAAGEQCDGGEYCQPDCSWTDCGNLSGNYIMLPQDPGTTISAAIDDNNDGTGLFRAFANGALILTAPFTYSGRIPGSALEGDFPLTIGSCSPIALVSGDTTFTRLE